MESEIYITKDTKLSKIKDKDKYTKMIIQTKINPNKLKEFINTKELVIDYIDKKDRNYNVENINLLHFKEKLEKLILRNINTLGRKESLKGPVYYSLDLPNLKSIELPSTIAHIDNNYLDELKNLEELIYNLSNNICIENYIRLNLSDKYNIKLKCGNEEYNIIPDYPINYIDNIIYHVSDGIVTLSYSYNSKIETNIKINTKTNNKTIKTRWQIHAIDDIIYIPDYVTSLSLGYFVYAKKISLNLKLLNEIEGLFNLTENCAISKLEVLELRSNNEMNLFPNKEINIKDYGILKKLYIENHLLYLDYDTFKIKINSKGELNREDKKDKLISSEGYISEEIIDYLCYKRFLEFIKREMNDKETQEALKVIEENVKKLIK